MKKQKTMILVLAGLFLALGLLLPMALGHWTGIPRFGMIFLPMHIPILLCGLICGYRWGAIVGFIVPLLSFFIFAMPPFIAIALWMAFELAVYGLVAGIVIKKANMFIALIVAMVCGRIVLAISQAIIISITGEFAFISYFAVGVFLTETFITALPGIAIQLVLIPAVMIALKKARLLPEGAKA